MRCSGEYPEHMICRAIQALEDILRYFLLKGKKPGKRLNVKWVNMKYEKARQNLDSIEIPSNL